MKRVIGLLLFLLFLSRTASALSWAYAFVVYDGRVYEVLNMPIAVSELGDVIGKVETAVNDETGRYYGNASNFYEVGTEYREVRGQSPDQVIAVEEDGVWKRAEYRFDSPYHVRELLDLLGYVLVGVGLFGMIYLLIKWRRSLRKRDFSSDETGRDS
ncbi:hypothetical protein [Exiguobacterium algae]|uniref:hypothetical protein n=1 Tax=Exiguobacterium algae TaxID=2751250 RepID=UPI001BE97B97|nr:hypothetical protein [Exiguobacterium algae]